MIVGIAMVKNEQDVLDTVLRHLLAEGVGHLIVADNLSTDNTPHILNDLEACGAPITVIQDHVLAYVQDTKMSRLARRAYEAGADWVLPFDADEIWYGVDPQTGEPCRIADALARVDDEIQVVRAFGWDHIQRVDESEAGKVGGRTFPNGFHRAEHPFFVRYMAGQDPAVFPEAIEYRARLAPFSPWRRQETQKLAKVAFRAHPDARMHMGNHDVTLPGPSITGPLAFRHFQYRSLEQMTTKLRQGREAYEASDVHPMHGTHWRAGGLKSDAELAAEWAELCAEDGLIFDPAPIR